MLDLEAIERIKQLKSRYFRYLDTADFDALATLFAADCRIHYRSPTYDHQKHGWDAISAFLQESFTDQRYGVHTGHHPEITVDGDTATGLWYLTDYFVSTDHKVTVEGSALYQDQYVKENGQWKIIVSEYDRLFEQITPRRDDQMVTSVPIGKKTPQPC